MRVVVGRIGRPHGIRGEVTVEPRTDEPDVRFAPGSVLHVDGPVRQLTVGRAHWHSGRLLIAFDGIDDRNAAEALRGLLLEVDRAEDERPEDPEEFYDSALVDCAVVDPAGAAIGIVREVVHLPGQDLLDIETAHGHRALVPFVTEIVPDVDIPGRRVVVDAPPGLLDPGE